MRGKYVEISTSVNSYGFINTRVTECQLSLRSLDHTFVTSAAIIYQFPACNNCNLQLKVTVRFHNQCNQLQCNLDNMID